MAYVPSKWMLGIIPVGVLWVLGAANTTANIEADLTAHATAAVDASTVDNLVISASGRDLTLTGAAFTPIGPHIAYQAAETVYGVRVVDADGVIVIPEVSPYVWSATKDGAKIALAGAVPDAAARAAVTKAAAGIPGAEVIDGMEYKRGDASALDAGAKFALGELGRLDKGSASLEGGALTISGIAADSKSYDLAIAALKTPPAGVKLAKVDIAAPPAEAPKVSEPAPAPGPAKAAEQVKPPEAAKDAAPAKAAEPAEPAK